jgi:hypothetical protein
VKNWFQSLFSNATCTATPWSAGGGEALYLAWLEYEEGVTEEAKLVKDMDKVELMLQAAEIENDENEGDDDGGGGGGGGGGGRGESGGNRGNTPDLTDFYTLALTRLKTETGRRWAAEVMRRRPTAGWAVATDRLAKALQGTAPMVVPDLARFNLTQLSQLNPRN